jgi:hypothetical protein
MDMNTKLNAAISIKEYVQAAFSTQNLVWQNRQHNQLVHSIQCHLLYGAQSCITMGPSTAEWVASLVTVQQTMPSALRGTVLHYHGTKHCRMGSIISYCAADNAICSKGHSPTLPWDQVLQNGQHHQLLRSIQRHLLYGAEPCNTMGPNTAEQLAPSVAAQHLLYGAQSCITMGPSTAGGTISCCTASNANCSMGHSPALSWDQVLQNRWHHQLLRSIQRHLLYGEQSCITMGPSTAELHCYRALQL